MEYKVVPYDAVAVDACFVAVGDEFFVLFATTQPFAQAAVEVKMRFENGVGAGEFAGEQHLHACHPIEHEAEGEQP